MKMTWGILAVAATTTMMLATGCDNNKTATNNEVPNAEATMGAAQSAGKALDEAGQNVKDNAHQAAADVKESAHEAGTEIKQGAHAAGAAVSHAAADAAQATDQAVEKAGHETRMAAAPMVLTPKIKTALGAEKRLNGSNINVDTKADTKQIVLTGTVTSAQQKSIASQIAMNELKESNSPFTVKNELVVGHA